MMPELNFIEAYKLLQPTAERGIIEARNKALTEIVGKLDMSQIVHLCRLAFNLPYDPAVYIDWFQSPLNQPDPQFFVAQDAAEAGRVATLALRHFVSDTRVALTVLSASYAGKRSALDNGELVAQSRNVITASAKKGGMKAPSDKIGFRKAGDVSKPRTDMTNGFDASHTGAFVDAVVQDLRGGTDAAVTALSDAYQVLRRDNLRLAEETDMLWWHVGDWSNILDTPRSLSE
jgi:hypothetical protein